ncbi:A disintegrin and metalloproteinase with thrombospondin motifs adt-2-like [Periplaneta americana]|uniref:A disintegrin and metalloproteinase with thrombospondin motifs adt-2-like n=1 Tax=Periplaneta americana TaxID=6978 RepID=UPI0037E7DC5C
MGRTRTHLAVVMEVLTLLVVVHAALGLPPQLLYVEEDVEVVYLRRTSFTSASSNEEALSLDYDDADSELRYEFTAFGRTVSLRLRPNTNLVAPSFRTYKQVDDHWVEPLPQPASNCHYLQHGGGVVAALSGCLHPNALHGFVILDNSTLEIRPIQAEAAVVVDNGAPHIVRRTPTVANLQLPDVLGDSAVTEAEMQDRPTRATQRPTVELALFFDAAGYQLFAPYFSGDDAKLRDMLLAYMNGVQALYHHPSLGHAIDLALVRLDLLSHQPSDLPHYSGERGKLLDSFCAYNARKNPAGDTNPEHWDMGLYVSGLDFFAYENGRKSGVTMGLATVGGVCQDKYACVIAELGTTNVFGKPYPSAGFTSVYILAHEIGHNLGMHHDSSQNSCPKEGYIMSPSRGTNGETVWSTCSADVISKLSWATCLNDVPSKIKPDMDHEARFQDEPGQRWGAKRQCEVLLRDKDAVLFDPDKLQDICQNLKCRTPHRSGFYFAGPALEGTTCGQNKWCQGGDCMPIKKKKPPAKVTPGGWGDWKPGTCSSGCIAKSKGFQPRRRVCDKPKPVNTDEGCEGSSVDVVLCADEKICKKKGKKRISVADFATKACANFSKVLPELDAKGAGLQAPHEDARLWMGCAIFCRRKDTGSYYTPRLDLNDLGVDPYFPDGTWCHNDGSSNYYCMQHHCLPENFRLGKSLPHLFGSDDVPLPQNAPPRLVPLSGDLLKYLSLGTDGRPLLTTLKPGSTLPPAEEEWTDHDYVELPPH